MGMRNTGGGGEIVQVQGGHIVRSTGRKDRHSKVYTAKGPRDRRVRLAAHTAIQFYDVQDRLGYDRPSKAVDWLIKKAKSAIDKLDELPPWHPNANNTTNIAEATAAAIDADVNAGCSSEIAGMEAQQSDSSGYGININPNNEAHFIPTSLDSDTIADTMKSFFPTTSASLSLNFQNYPHHIISNSANKSQDLCLSLHSYQDPNRDSSHHGNPTEQTLFAAPDDTVGFEPSSGGWADHQQHEMGRFQRMMSWNGGGDGENRGGFLFNSSAFAHNHHQQQLLNSSQVGSDFCQRGTLQSSFATSVRAWDDHDTQEIHRNSISGDHRFVSEGFSGYCIPARIHGGEEHDNNNKTSSASPHSHH